MKTRQQLVLLLLLSGFILALLPLTANRSFKGRPTDLLHEVLDPGRSFTADQVAQFVAQETPDIMLLDLRPPEEFQKGFIPGAVNVPYGDLITGDPDIWLRDTTQRILFYSSDETEAAMAMTYAQGVGYRNTWFMRGGISEWVNTVSDTHFTGEKISARENSILEMRRRAGELYKDLLAMPDSLKSEYLESRRFAARQLDGGC